MSPKIVDVLIFIPLIPAVPVIATWFLPWERWIPKRIPKTIIGPYLLYGSFAAWHFRMSSWFILLLAAWGIVLWATVVPHIWEAIRRKQADDWPVVEGSVVHVGESRDTWEVKVTLTYTYRVQGKLYAGSQAFFFRKGEDAACFKDKRKEGTAQVHYRPDKPDVSVLALGGAP